MAKPSSLGYKFYKRQLNCKPFYKPASGKCCAIVCLNFTVHTNAAQTLTFAGAARNYNGIRNMIVVIEQHNAHEYWYCSMRCFASGPHLRDRLNWDVEVLAVRNVTGTMTSAQLHHLQ